MDKIGDNQTSLYKFCYYLKRRKWEGWNYNLIKMRERDSNVKINIHSKYLFLNSHLSSFILSCFSKKNPKKVTKHKNKIEIEKSEERVNPIYFFYIIKRRENQ